MNLTFFKLLIVYNRSKQKRSLAVVAVSGNFAG